MTVGVMFGHDELPEGTLFAPMIDARRMEVYTAVYDLSLRPLMEPRPLILDSGENAVFIPDVNPLAVDMVALSERSWREKDFLDLAYSTPLYLKDFQATKPRNLFA